MKFIKKNWGKLALITYVLIFPIVSFAENITPSDPATSGRILNPLASSKINSIPEFIKTILEGAIKVGLPVVALAIVYCGFLFVAARGNSEKLIKAKDALLYTIIGAAILIGSWAIAKMIQVTVTGLGS